MVTKVLQSVVVATKAGVTAGNRTGVRSCPLVYLHVSSQVAVGREDLVARTVWTWELSRCLMNFR